MIQFLKTIPDDRNHLGLYYTQWFLLLASVL
jgi:hypothetical protein